MRNKILMKKKNAGKKLAFFFNAVIICINMQDSEEN